MKMLVNIYQRKSLSFFYHVTRCKYSSNLNTNKIPSTVDQNEITFMNKMSKDWLDKNGPVKILHAMNKIRIEFITNGLISSGQLTEEKALNNPLYLNDIKIADIGCGGGILTLELGKLGSNIVGIEPSEVLVEIGNDGIKMFQPAGKTEFIATSVEEFAKDKSNQFDAVVCSEVIEHVTKKEGFVEACVKILKPGGSIFITTPDKTFLAKFLGIFMAEYVLRLVPKGLHQYEKFISPDELKQMLDKNSCDTKMVKKFTYSPYSNTFYWTSLAVFYALHAVKKQ